VAIPTEPIGSIPRPRELLGAMAARDRGETGPDEIAAAPFADDISTTRETAFAKIAARVEGTALASAALGL
jgi:methionine synthase II (cobalamin-independent)